MAFAAPGALLLGAGISDWFRLREHVVPGVRILSEPIGGYGKEALSAHLARRQTELAAQRFRVRVGEREFETSLAQMGASLDVDALRSGALAVARVGAMPLRLRERFGAWWGQSVAIEPLLRFDASALRARLQEWQQAALRAPVEGGLVLDGHQFRRRYPETGQSLTEARVEQALLEQLKAGEPPLRVLQLPADTTHPLLSREAVDAAWEQATQLTQRALTLRGPAPVSLQAGEGDVVQQAVPSLRFSPEVLRAALTMQIESDSTRLEQQPRLGLSFTLEGLQPALAAQRDEIEVKPQDAKFLVDHQDRVSVTPSVPGTLIVDSQLASRVWQLASTGETTGELPLQHQIAPKLQTAEAEGLNIRRLVSSFTTRYACCQPRGKNIQRIAELLDGTVLRPGERYSVNDAVGPRTPANGFVPAPTIVRGDIEDTSGGGVSQFATTLFNAVLHGGYEVIERQPHSYYFERYPIGHEATLSFPKPDLIFRNDTQSGLLLKTHYSPTSITVKLYGDNEGRQVKTSRGGRFNLTEPTTVYEPNDELSPEAEEVLERGQTGWTVEVSRVVTLKDGSKKEERREVTYNPRDRVLQVHSCKIPEGEPGHTGRDCPAPEPCDAADPACENPACSQEDAECLRMQRIRELVDARSRE
ncbi:MAG: hypothetical protein RJA70_4050 [Pseudomonadota bacterium]